MNKNQEIRKEETKSTRESRSFFEQSVWNNNGLNRKEETQNMIDSYNRLYSTASDNQKKEMDLMARITAATEGDTYEKRLDDARKKAQVSKIVEDKLLHDFDKDRVTEEDFQEERNEFGNKYRRFVKQAQKEVYGN